MKTEGRKQKEDSRNQKPESRRLKAGGGERTREKGQGLNAKNCRFGYAPVAALVCLMSMSLAESGFARQTKPNLTFTVGVYNYAQASPAMVAGAEFEAGRILGVAGVWIVWQDCGPPDPPNYLQSPCHEPGGIAYIELRILPQPIKNVFQNDPPGYAIAPAVANVYYHEALNFVGGEGSVFAGQTILGCVMAHEIGHLLLGSNSHSDSGIMRAMWESEDMQPQLIGRRLFTPAQAKLIRAEVRRREQPPRAGTARMDSPGPGRIE